MAIGLRFLSDRCCRSKLGESLYGRIGNFWVAYSLRLVPHALSPDRRFGVMFRTWFRVNVNLAIRMRLRQFSDPSLHWRVCSLVHLPLRRLCLRAHTYTSIPLAPRVPLRRWCGWSSWLIKVRWLTMSRCRGASRDRRMRALVLK